MQKPVRYQCCGPCGNSSSSTVDEFKIVVNLKNSGLSIFVHDSDISENRTSDDKRGSIILYNTGNKELKRYDYIAEMCQYKTKCYKCKENIKYARYLIDNLTTINKNAILGICNHCKRSPTKNKCKRCDYIIRKFLDKKMEQHLKNENRFHNWLRKVHKILLSVLQGELVCKHNFVLNDESKIELDKLLRYLNISSTLHQPAISPILDFTWAGEICSGLHKIVLSELCKNDINTEKLNNSHLSSSLDILSLPKTDTCVCKYLKTKKINEQSKNEKELKGSEVMNTKVSVRLSTKSKMVSNKKSGEKTNIKPGKHIINIKNIKKNTNFTDRKKINKEYTNVKSKELKQNYLSITKMGKRGIDKHFHQKNMKSTKFVRDNILQRKMNCVTKVEDNCDKIETEDSESIIECRDVKPDINEMIKGTKLVPLKYSHVAREVGKHFPMLYNESECKSPIEKSTLPHSYKLENITENNKQKYLLERNPGLFIYQLSNRKFVDKGWTILPSTKIMRRMFLYKMIPTSSNYNWFYKLIQQKILYYDTGEKLAELYKDGCVKWYYKTGCAALDYYNSSDISSEKRCTIYDITKERDSKQKDCDNILACFDYVGNGIIYDSQCNIRLKYNQSEGMVIDKKIGPPGRWKWNALNDPPVLFPVLFDTFANEEQWPESLERNENPLNNEMNTIEYEKNLKEKSYKVLKKVKPFQIRMKALKINNYFSLRIVSQSKIYIQFSSQQIHFKINVGMLLKSDEIIGTDISEVSEVSTPFEFKQKYRFKAHVNYS